MVSGFVGTACASNTATQIVPANQAGTIAQPTAASTAGVTATDRGGAGAGMGGIGAAVGGSAGVGASVTGGSSAGSAGARDGTAGAAAGGSGAGTGGAGGTSNSGSSAGAAGAPAQAGAGAGGGAGDSPAAGSGGSGTGAAAAAGTVPIEAPVADDCIRDVGAGDHSFACQGLTYLVTVGERCTKFACGLIFDVHGAAMSGEIQRTNTQLHELAPPMGYLTVHPTAASTTWDLQADPPKIANFMERMIKAFHVDTKRVHVTGFSMGAAMTFWFLCNYRDGLASTAPVTGESAEQVTVAASGDPCIASIDSGWKPRVPILFMSGTMDGALTIERARMRTEGIVNRLGLTGGDMVDGDDSFMRKRWTGADGMVFDFLEHNYTNALLQGHCIPGEPASNFTACTSGGTTLHWGQVVLQWFIDHPKP